ncbi:macro domain-containing protein [Cohnella sp.]|uniref:macro domain-containing protein n=1 Tax=Cohnella sp. TaxID=1883426 RepID=UPI0035664B18
MNIVFVDTNLDVCRALDDAFRGVSGVEVEHGRFQDVPEWDCVVSPANSYGMMDGGFDLHLSRFFGPMLQQNVHDVISRQHAGVQPVGTCEIVETGSIKHPFVAHAPTMVVPGPIHMTNNVFFAMKAVLLAAKKHNRKGKRIIQRLLCPGLGTATGHVPPHSAARQMRRAFGLVADPPKGMDWNEAQKIQISIAPG